MIPAADAPMIPAADAPMVPDDDAPMTPDADAPMASDVDAPAIPGDALATPDDAQGSGEHLGTSFKISITLISSSETRSSSGLEVACVEASHGRNGSLACGRNSHTYPGVLPAVLSP